MNILFDHQAFSMQSFGGISRYFYQLIKGLSKNHNCILPLKYTNNYYIKELSDYSGSSYVNDLQFRKKKPFGEFVNRRYSIRLIKQKNYDVFHPTYYNPYFLKMIGEKPFVVTVHDLTHEIFPSEYSGRDKTSQHKSRVIKKANHIIAVSNNTKNDIIERYKIPENRISVIYHGYNMDIEKKNDFPDIQLVENYILYVGARDKHKNFNHLVEAVTPILKKNGQLNLVCAGGGNFREEEKQLFTNLGIKERVFQYSATDSMLGWLYRHALCFVYPSYYEGFGLPVLESFSHNCPVIVSNRSSLSEVAGDAALIIEPENPASIQQQISTILSDEQLRQELISKGQKRLSLFSWQKAVEQTEQVYNLLT